MDSIKLLWYCFISERGRRIASLDKMKENSRKIGQLSVFPGSLWDFNQKIGTDFNPNVSEIFDFRAYCRILVSEC